MGRNTRPHFRFEKEAFKRGFLCVAGVDEVGRGAWAGPLVAAAVVLSPKRAWARLGLRDSKQLPASKREQLRERLEKWGAELGIGEVTVAEINRLGLGPATRLAMQRAIDALPQKPDLILVDGRRVLFPGIASRAIVGGDRRSLSVAAASITAKVRRDGIMRQQGLSFYPRYFFEVHKGYGTKLHQKCLEKFGPSLWHRSNFRPIGLLREKHFEQVKG